MRQVQADEGSCYIDCAGFPSFKEWGMNDAVRIKRNRCDGTDISNNQPIHAVKISLVSPSFLPAFVNFFPLSCVKFHGRVILEIPKEAIDRKSVV